MIYFKSKQTKTFFLAAGLLAFVAFFIGLALLAGWLVNKQTENRKNIKSFSALLSEGNWKIETPDKFPKDFPLPESKLIYAYSMNSQTKDMMAVFESKKSAKENYDFYIDYAKDNNWTIDEAREPTDTKAAKILLRDKHITITVALEKNKNGSQITIFSTSLATVPGKEEINIKSLNLSGAPEQRFPAPKGELPEGFPKDFPLRGKTQLLDAHTLKNPASSQTAYTVRFNSSEDSQKIEEFYTAWLKDNGWMVIDPAEIKQKEFIDKKTVSASVLFKKSVKIDIYNNDIAADDSISAPSRVEVVLRVFGE
ncbi:MAG: hypothetical protein HYV53_02150 [Parcubacteria group bacterium]|nr:hypothetical protein [Parcubacteria group bacterium]